MMVDKNAVEGMENLCEWIWALLHAEMIIIITSVRLKWVEMEKRRKLLFDINAAMDSNDHQMVALAVQR